MVALDNFITGSYRNIQHLIGNRQFEFVHHDISNPLYLPGEIDAVLHFASPASPIDYLRYPLETLRVGSYGTHVALELAREKRARFLMAEPLIAIHHVDCTGLPLWQAHGWHDAQFQAFDLVSGRIWPQIGGDPSFLDLVGVNYYFANQWIHGGRPVDVDDVIYRPLSDLLVEVAPA